MDSLKEFVKKYFGILIIAAAFVVSAVIVTVNNVQVADTQYVIKTGDTLARIAEEYQTTVEKLCEENYPDLSPAVPLTPGSKIKLPRESRAKLITVRLAHWNLEPGAREGVNLMIKRYTALHPNVRIVQEAIPESTYAQWYTTQMVGHTPADLMHEAGVAYPLLISYYIRYFTPLTEYVMKPNPYNKGTEFENTPLRDTIKDGLRSCYNADLQEYMTIGLAQHLVRMYYNKSMLKKVTGSDDPPKTFKEFMDVCALIAKEPYYDTAARKSIASYSNELVRLSAERQKKSSDAARIDAQIAEQRRMLDEAVRTGKRMMPIANSKYHMNAVENWLFNAITSKARTIVDYNHDCSVSAVEQYIAMKLKRIDMNYGPYRAKFEIVSNYCAYSVPGFAGLNRDDAVMSFIQSRSLFIPTGTWEAGMLQKQAEDNGFELGVMDFPYPGPDSPELYKYMEGPAFEDPWGSFKFAVATPESDPERRRTTIDFLLFMVAKDNNIALNDITGWPPYVKGAPAKGVLKYFVPHPDGVLPGMNFSIGGESVIKWQQLYTLYWVGQVSYDKFRADFEPYYLSRGYQDYLTVNKNWRRSLAADEKQLSIMRAKAMRSVNAEAAGDLWHKYRYVMMRPLTREVDVSYERALLQSAEQGNVSMGNAYEYSPGARARLGMPVQ
ncbi:MAG: extracellular solute-binding protein [Spirochaetes bacterium]|nr:extracellular solute-binding protein [Spirochaetota bacterium]